MKLLVRIEKDIAINDVEEMINHFDQGWKFLRTDPNLTLMIFIGRNIEMEIEDDFTTARKTIKYIDTLRELGNVNVPWFILGDKEWDYDEITEIYLPCEMWEELENGGI